MASASNLKKSGASYDLILNDQMSMKLDKVIGKLKLLDTVTGKVAAPLRQLSGSLKKVGAATALGAISSTITAAIQSVQMLVRIFQSGIRIVMQFGRMAVSALKSIITEASHATETLNAFMAVFKGQAEATLGFTNEFSDAVGRSMTDMRNYAKSFQAFFVGLELAPEKAAVLSRNLVRLTADFGSFFDRADEEGFRRFISALSGSSEVLDQFGINIRENKLELKAQELGYGDNVRKMTELQKALARLAIIQETLTAQGAVGDAIRTQFEWANQTKALAGAWKDLKATLGAFAIAALIPVLRGVVAAVQRVKAAFIDLKENGGIEGFIASLGTLGKVVEAWAKAFTALGEQIANFNFGAIVEIFSIIGKVSAYAFLDQFRDVLIQGLISTLKFATGLWRVFLQNPANFPAALLAGAWKNGGFELAQLLFDPLEASLDMLSTDFDGMIDDLIERLEELGGTLISGEGIDKFISELEDMRAILTGEAGKQVAGAGGKGGRSDMFTGTTSAFVASRLAAMTGGNAMDQLLTVANNSLQVERGMLDTLDEIRARMKGGGTFK